MHLPWYKKASWVFSMSPVIAGKSVPHCFLHECSFPLFYFHCPRIQSGNQVGTLWGGAMIEGPQLTACLLLLKPAWDNHFPSGASGETPVGDQGERRGNLGRETGQKFLRMFPLLLINHVYLIVGIITSLLWDFCLLFFLYLMGRHQKWSIKWMYVY